MTNNVEEYYYLPHVKLQRVKMKELKSDLARGVKWLSDSSYVALSGSTIGSLQFCLMMVSILGEEGMQAKRAELKTYRTREIILIVTLTNGLELAFTGVNAGYYGEGTRGCHDILKMCGFNKKQCNYPFERSTFTCSKQ